MFHAPSLFDVLPVAVDRSFGTAVLTTLDATSWVETVPGWLDGAGEVFARLDDALPWRQRRVPMYDALVDEPRLTAWWSDGDGPEPLPVLGEIRGLLSDRYGVGFDSIGFNLYRDGSDSVAWHGDRHRDRVTDPVVAILSVGENRAFSLRPRPGSSAATTVGSRSRSISWHLGHGHLLVMGGACQHDWQHCVPKSRSVVGPRMSITFRHDAR